MLHLEFELNESVNVLIMINIWFVFVIHVYAKFYSTLGCFLLVLPLVPVRDVKSCLSKGNTGSLNSTGAALLLDLALVFGIMSV
jgi:hypothetical protein